MASDDRLGKSFSDDLDEGDPHRIARDYAMMRLEVFEASDLLGCIEEDFKDIATEFHSAQKQLLLKLSAHDRQSECGITVKFDNTMKKVLSRLRSQNVISKITLENTKCGFVSAKLPRIIIKSFDGKLENWISYIQIFESLIHKKEISNVEKLHYLLSSVEGKAFDLIKNYPLTDESYLDAYNTLNKYYNKKRHIAMTYFDKLVLCEPIKTKSGFELERIYRTFEGNLNVLEKFNLPDKNFMLFHLLWSKLDKSTREAFQLEFNSDDIPDYKLVQEFIEKHIRALEIDSGGKFVNNSATNVKGSHFKKAKSSLVVSTLNCEFCSGQHTLSSCSEFLKLNAFSRYEFVKGKTLCLCCFSKNHLVKTCKESARCGECGYSHHTLLHFSKLALKSENSRAAEVIKKPSCSTNSGVALTSATNINTALFSTAKILIKDGSGNYQSARALLDCASACNFISFPCARRLGLKIENCGYQFVNGIGHSVANPIGSISCEIMPMNSNKNINFEIFVLPSICDDQPSCVVNPSDWRHIKNLTLADPDFTSPGPIDILLGVNIFASSLRPGLKQGKHGQPKALNTLFGWIIMGECDMGHSHNYKNESFLVSQASLLLDSSITRFWELENVETHKAVVLSKDELSCENYMEGSYCRNPEGRMVVPLTFVDPQNKPQFSGSRNIALKRLQNLERKFKLNHQFQTAYVNFMHDYLQSGYMVEVEPPLSSNGHFYYIPHHGVLRVDSVTTPLRTVFDAGAKDAAERSLNDTLLPGPKLQKSIFDLLIRFRWHAIVFTADIKQMYRQFLVVAEDSNYQRILWRPSPDEPVKDFRLLTVTYGVSCAPYQALWCIKRLAQEFSSRLSCGATVLARDTFVDDVVSGTDSVESALLVRKELLEILSSSSLHLRKWTSNNEEFLKDLSDSDLYSEQFRNFEDVSDVSLKILGLLWLPKSDNFSFKTTSFENRCTKRSILSDIARIFDPLGLLSPVVFLAKYLMQLLWSSGVDWDEDVPEAISREWLKFKSQLSSLSSLSIPRRVIESYVDIQFHGFCDASERGYCAVVYCRIVRDNRDIIVRLYCAKSKVAPLRRLSIPRLELLSAVLLADLLSSVAFALNDFHCVDKIFAWSDSTVALTWIRSCPSRWKTFVANRTASIQEKLPPECWRHVCTGDNPADHGSRGLSPANLVHCGSWWAGPAWLSCAENKWPSSLEHFDGAALDEQKVLTLFTATKSNFIDRLLIRFSSFRRIIHILAYCFRYLHNLKHPNQRRIGKALSSNETNFVIKFLVKIVQEIVFASEIRHIHSGSTNSLPKPLRRLCPFMDKEGLLRVGGRLSQSDMDYEKKHPLLLPRDHRLTTLIIEEYHRRFLHPGLQTLQNLLAQEFWILSSKRAIRSVVSSCIKCFRVSPRLSSPPIMGDLPSYHISQLKPFSSASVDYAGPFNISLGRARGSKSYKGYVCVFVCTATKAVHLELTSELTSDSYLAALKRFISRRGRCSRLISDQGRNFVGASNILKDLMSEASQVEQIEFVFNPPGSPHFSGLVEAGVKSVKTHLARVIGLQCLTFEEFYTLLTQIESLLNSRPLSPLSSDPNDFSVLTPGHFLSLEPLTILPEEDFTEVRVSPLQRWKLLTKMHQDFWRRWHLEYVHTLQQRHKWSETHKNITVGSMVLIVNEILPPLRWSIGRVVRLHPGADGVCRVVTVRTAKGELKRPVVKLCPLPPNNEICNP